MALVGKSFEPTFEKWHRGAFEDNEFQTASAP